MAEDHGFENKEALKREVPSSMQYFSTTSRKQHTAPGSSLVGIEGAVSFPASGERQKEKRGRRETKLGCYAANSSPHHLQNQMAEVSSSDKCSKRRRAPLVNKAERSAATHQGFYSQKKMSPTDISSHEEPSHRSFAPLENSVECNMAWHSKQTLPNQKTGWPPHSGDGKMTCKAKPEDSTPDFLQKEGLGEVQQCNLADDLLVPSNPYMPGRVKGRPLHFLIDTGCTNSILSKRVFDHLPRASRQLLRPSRDGATMADGSRTKIYGQIELDVKLRSIPKTINFQVARTHHDAILGMDFLQDGCVLDLGKALMTVEGKELSCTDRFGTLLASKVQVLRPTIIPPESEYSVACRISNPVSGRQGLIEGNGDGSIAVAACLVSPTLKKRTVPVRCWNPSSYPLTLRAGSVIASYTAVTEHQVVTMDEEPALSNLEMVKKTPDDKTIQPTSVPEHVSSLYAEACANCKSAEERQEMAKLLCSYQDVFSSGKDDVGLTKLVTHSIPVLPGTRPIKQPPRRLGAARDEEVEKQVKELLEQGRIEPHNGAWSSPVVLVGKKDGTWRMCVDYRKLNAVTQQDAYPLSRIDDSLDSLAGSQFFSTLDLLSGYWQVPLDEDAQEKSAFVTRGGLWKWKVLPFGLTSAPACFERLMEKVLTGLQWRTLLLYLDDVIVFGSSFQQHLERLEEVLKRFRHAGLKLKPSKCELLKPRVAYLGHVVGPDGVQTDPKKIEAVRNWPTPQCQTDLRTFLGFAGYYRRFVPGFATTAKPLSALTGQNARFEWTSACQTAFDELKQALLTAPVLAYPQPKTEFILDTDASGDGLGAVLSQLQDGEERPVAYWSKTLSPAERNYCVTR